MLLKAWYLNLLFGNFQIVRPNYIIKCNLFVNKNTKSWYSCQPFQKQSYSDLNDKAIYPIAQIELKS